MTLASAATNAVNAGSTGVLSSWPGASLATSARCSMPSTLQALSRPIDLKPSLISWALAVNAHRPSSPRRGYRRGVSASGERLGEANTMTTQRASVMAAWIRASFNDPASGPSMA